MMTSRFLKFSLLSCFAAALMMTAAEAQPPGGRGEGGRGEGGRGQEGRGQRGQQRGGFQFGGQRGSQFGQRTARVPSFSELLRSEDVLEELKVGEAQKATIDAAMESYRAESAKLRPSREAFEGLDSDARREMFEKMQKDGQELRDKTDEILTALLEKEQIARLKQIQFQIQVSQSLTAYMKSDEGRKALSITDEQLAKIESVEEEAQKGSEEARNKMRELFSGGERPSREEMQEIFARLREESTKRREETTKKIEGVLTEEQQAKLASLKGDEFKYDRAAMFGRGGRGGQGGPGGGRPQGGFGRGGQGGEGGRGRGGRGEGGGERRRPAIEDDAV